MVKATPYAVAVAALLGLAAPLAAEAQTSSRDSTLAARTGTYSVADLQRALAQAGYNPGPADGLMGPGTRAAIEAFQRDQGLSVTGTPTAALYQALERQGFLAARAAPPSLSRDQTADLRDVERRLQRAGYDPGPVDGTMDWRARAALRDFQKEAGIPITGSVDEDTLAALNRRTALPSDQTAASRVDADLVEDLQLALRARGNEDITVTGELDARTRAAIRSYQREAGLPVTGQPSSELLAMIETGRTPARSAEQDRAALVRDIEIALRNKGYTVGTINGVMEPETAAAIQQYQEQRGLWPRGEPTPELLADIRSSDVRAPDEQQARQEEPADPSTQLFRLLGERALEQIQNR